MEAINNKKDTFNCNKYSYKILESKIYMHPISDKDDEPLIISEENVIRKVHVYKVKCHCLTCENKYGYNSIANRLATFITASNKIVEVELSFCKHCGEYYINSKSLEEY